MQQDVKQTLSDCIQRLPYSIGLETEAEIDYLVATEQGSTEPVEVPLGMVVSLLKYYKSNKRRKRKAGSFVSGSEHPFAKLTPDDVRGVRAKLNAGIGKAAIARYYRVSPLVITRIQKGFSYKEVL
jgi:hypothetical protein